MMISVKEAKQIIEINTNTGLVINTPLIDATGCILANDVVSPIDSPPFNNSAMDGFAFAYNTVDLNSKISVVGTIQAGSTVKTTINGGAAVKIFTGAPIPDGVDTVVMKEWATEEDYTVTFNNQKIIKGSHIRYAGSQIEKGAIAAKAGTKLTPGVIGYLAGLGVIEVEIYSAPKIGIVVTGKELVLAGNDLAYGQIYESNSIMLMSALYEGRMEPQMVSFADDVEEDVLETITNTINQCDIALITGGISVGDFDFVGSALKKCNTETLFYKVKQKPGKPLFFGKNGNTLIFGLPGNPASVLSCFYEYVAPCIKKWCGIQSTALAEPTHILNNDTFKKAGLTYFLKGKLNGNTVTVLDGQESYKLNAFTEADCLVVLDEDKEIYNKGEQVKIHKINDCWN